MTLKFVTSAEIFQNFTWSTCLKGGLNVWICSMKHLKSEFKFLFCGNWLNDIMLFNLSLWQYVWNQVQMENDDYKENVKKYIKM